MPEPAKKPNFRYYSDLAKENPAALAQVRDEFFRTLKLEHPLERVAKFTREAVDVEKREVTLSLSSEEPVERFFGMEILGHEKDEIDASRLEADAPWLWMHDWFDQRGVIVAWSVEDKKLRVTIKLSRNPKGEELLQDMADGITKNTSVGYFVNEFKEMTPPNAGKDALRVFRAVRWTPYEGSSVTVPADFTVGVGRAQDPVKTPTPTKEHKTMTPEQLKALQGRRAAGESLSSEETAALNAYEAGLAAARAAQPPAPTVELKAGEKAVAAERERVAGLNMIVEQHPGNEKIRQLVAEGIKEGHAVNHVGMLALEVLGKVKRVSAEGLDQNGSLGMNAEQVKRYSLRKAMKEMLDGTLTGLEAEAHQEAKNRGMVSTRGGAFVPFDVLKTNRRDLSTSFAAGGALIGSDAIGFVELLRNKAVLFKAGAQLLSGLKGDVYMSRQTGASSMYWVADGSAPTESNPTFGQIQMSPKHGSALVEVTRQLLMQSDPSVDAIVNADLLKQVQLGIDAAGLNGSGFSGEPRGLCNWSGIGAFTGASIALAYLLNAEADIATANADEATLRWITTPGVREILKAKQRFSSTDTPLWTDANTILGYQAMSTNQMPSAKMLFGDFSQSVTGIWGPGIELVVNPHGTNARAGNVEFQAWVSMDHALRQAGAMTLASSISA